MALLTFEVVRKDDEKLVLSRDVTSRRQYNSWVYALAYLPDYLKVVEIKK